MTPIKATFNFYTFHRSFPLMVIVTDVSTGQSYRNVPNVFNTVANGINRAYNAYQRYRKPAAQAVTLARAGYNAYKSWAGSGASSSRAIGNGRGSSGWAVRTLRGGKRRKRVGVKRGRKGKGRAKRGSTKDVRLNNLLNVNQDSFYEHSDFGFATVPASALNAKGCVYFAANAGAPWTSKDPQVWPSIAYTCQTAADPPNDLFVQRNFSAVTWLTNQSNSQIRITAYKMVSRLDQPASDYVTIQNLMGEGFASRGIDTSRPDNSNNALALADYSIYQTGTFLEKFKIVRTKTKVLQPGRVAKFKINDSRDIIVRPHSMSKFTSGQTYANATKLWNYMRGETFWMFRAEGNQLGDNNASPTTLAFPQSRVNFETRYIYTFQYCSQYTSGAITTSTSNLGASLNTLIVPTQTQSSVVGASY